MDLSGPTAKRAKVGLGGRDGRVRPPRPTFARFAVGPERSIDVKMLSL